VPGHGKAQHQEVNIQVPVVMTMAGREKRSSMLINTKKDAIDNIPDSTLVDLPWIIRQHYGVERWWERMKMMPLAQKSLRAARHLCLSSEYSREQKMKLDVMRQSSVVWTQLHF
jgi:hypothetical protein